MALQRTAFITGFTGQDGTFLTELLLKKGYKVVGLVRRVSTEPPFRVRGRFDFSPELSTGQLVLEMGDLLSPDSLIRIIKKHQPQEIYNLAAQSDVHVSFMQPEFSIDSTFMGVVNLITALEAVGGDNWRMYQASTSEMFGDIKTLDGGPRPRISEDTPLNANSPYAIAKMAAHQYCKMKREQGRFISCGILFNHESEIRGGNFVTQKIVRQVVQWEIDYQELKDDPQPLELGNLDSVRDWGYAGDYVIAMWKMLQVNDPGDFVVGTGAAKTVRDFATAAAMAAITTRDISIRWDGTGKNARGYIDDILFVVVSEKYWRPVDVRFLQADPSKAQAVLDWKPQVGFQKLVDIMVAAEQDRRREYER